MSGDELPEGWRESNLGAVIDGFESGRNLQALGRPSEPNEFGVLKISAVTWGEFNPHENKALLPDDKPKPREIVHGGDLLITRANTTALVGAVVRVATDYPRLMLPDKILRICYRADEVDPDFLMHSLRTTAVREYFEENATGTSDSMRNLSQPKLEAAPLALPPLPEQRRIVAKLESLQARSRRAREALEAVPPLLEKLRQSILAAAFRGDLTKDWREKHPEVEPASELLNRIRVERRKKWEEAELAKMKAKGKVAADDKWKARYVEPEPVDESELPELPEGWCWARVQELADVVDPQPSHRTPPEFANGTPYIGIGDVKSDRVLDLDNSRRVGPDVLAEHRERYTLRSGDFIFGKIGTLGAPCRLPQPFDYVLTANVVLIQPWQCANLPEWLYFFMLSPQITNLLADESRATSQPAFGIKKVRELVLPLPPEEEQQTASKLLDAALTHLVKIQRSLTEEGATLDALNNAILSKAFRGELVPQEPGDAIDGQGDVASAPAEAQACASPKARGNRGPGAKRQK